MGPAALQASTQEDDLYGQMKCSQGGVMLLVRLHADMSVMSPEEIRHLAGSPDGVEAGSRLAVTYGWLCKQFGPPNARTAVRETAAELLALKEVAGVQRRPRAFQDVSETRT